MRTKFIIFLMIFITTAIYSQAPNKMSYQAVIRNAEGKLVVNKDIVIKISILKGGIGDDDRVFIESHNTKTNANGLVSVEIGAGTPISGSFALLDWGNDKFYVRSEVDLEGNGNFAISGTTQLLSVPYALFAKNVETISEEDPVFTDSPAKEITDEDIGFWNKAYKWGNHSNAGYLKEEKDSSVTNELQTLELHGDTLVITQGNELKLAIGGDQWGRQVVKKDTTLLGDGTVENVLKINPDVVALKSDLYDIAQTLQIVGDTLSISSGNSVVLPNGNDNWGNQFVLKDSTLLGDGTKVNKLKVNTEVIAKKSDLVGLKQSLELKGDTLSISNGNSVNLPTGDKWGEQVVVKNTTLVGNGTEVDTLKVNTDIIATKEYVDHVLAILENGGFSLVDFSSNGVLFSIGEVVEFKDESNINATSWNWNFGDGTSSNVKNPIKIYDEIGNYTVSLTASDGVFTRIKTKENFIEVNNFPNVITNNIINISSTYATGGGVVLNDGGATVFARGICWSLVANPTLNDNFTQEGTGIGEFESQLTGLIGNTKYYVRAYATNSSGTKYGSEVSFTTDVQGPPDVVDYDGNVYRTVQIGDQIWMKENLKTTHYADGVVIPNITDNSEWGALENNSTDKAFCYYDNYSNGDYGALYTWAAAMNGDESSVLIPSGVQGVCPSGWHIPSDGEWLDLFTNLGGEALAGGKMKEEGTNHWFSPNTGATNSSRFTALAGGYRSSGTGLFARAKGDGIFWSSTKGYNHTAFSYKLLSDRQDIIRSNGNAKANGFSVRCVKN